MKIQQLAELSDAAYLLHHYSDVLMSTFEPDYRTPEDFDSLKEWREHLGNLCGHYRMVVAQRYNNVDGWQDIGTSSLR